MKIRVYAALSGYNYLANKDIIEIPDENLNGLNKIQKDEYIQNEIQEWVNEQFESWYEEIEGDEEDEN